MDLFQGAFELVETALDTYISSTVGDVVAYIAPIFTSMMILWIAVWGYMMMFGKVSEPLQEGVFRIIRIGFIMTLGLTVGTYMDVVVDVLAHGPEEIAAVVTGTPADSMASIMDELFSRVFEIAERAWDKAGVMNGNFGLYLIALAILVAGGAVAFIVAFLILLSKIMTTLLLGIGPLFIIGLLFNTTQRWFESWLGQVMNFGMILVLAAAGGRLALEFCELFLDRMTAGGGDLTAMWDAAVFVMFFGLCFLFLKQVPAMASALCGGIALATQGALGSAMNAMRPSTIRRQYRGVQRDARLAGAAAAAPVKGVYKAGRAAQRAYQKRFSANTITGG